MEQGGLYRACPLPPDVQADFVSLPSQVCLSSGPPQNVCVCVFSQCDFSQVALVTGA